MTNVYDEDEETAVEIAFIFLADAFTEVADALLERDPKGGQQILDDLRHKLAVNIDLLAADDPQMYHRTKTAAAAEQINGIIFAAQGKVEGE